MGRPAKPTRRLMIVTIDGPAGAGKSSAARGLARRLGFRFLDTGAMYRCVALAADHDQIPLDDAEAMTNLAESLQIELTDDTVILNGEDVTTPIRALDITGKTRFAAANPGVRAHLVVLQRQAAAGKDVVTEGRDQGTVVFPEAECKIFLTASSGERARRRWLDLRQRGENVTLEEVLLRQEDRDRRDRERTVGPLIKADDAIEVSTDGMEPAAVIDALEALARAALNVGP